MENAIRIRRGAAADSRRLAELMNAAGEGIPAFLWSEMAGPGGDPFEIGRQRVQRSDGAFSYANTHVAVVDDALAGMLLSYRLPDPYDIDAHTDVPAIVRPALELEARVPGCWYINAVATAEAFRRRGIARALMHHGEDLARAAGAESVSLIVAEENEPACRLYERLGYRVVARRPVATFPGFPHEGDWQLMHKALA